MKRRSSVFLPLRRAGSLPRFAITSVIVTACAFLNIGMSRAEQAPALVLHRTVTYADRQTYIELPFEVPEGVTRVSIETSYTEREKHTAIDLGLFDGETFRDGAEATNRHSPSQRQMPHRLIFLGRFGPEGGS